MSANIARLVFCGAAHVFTAQLQAQHVAQFPIHCERVKRAADNIHGLQTQLVGSEQRLATEDDDSEYNDYNDADCTVADWRAETQAAKRLRSEIGEAQRGFREAQRDVRTTLSSSQRTEVQRLMRDGHSALTIQSMLSPTPEFAPPLEAIQYTMDNERRRTRCGLEAYEAMHWMCRDLLADQQRVMLYLVWMACLCGHDEADGRAQKPGPTVALWRNQWSHASRRSSRRSRQSLSESRESSSGGSRGSKGEGNGDGSTSSEGEGTGSRRGSEREGSSSTGSEDRQNR